MKERASIRNYGWQQARKMAAVMLILAGAREW
jgi:hypothetical protein